MVEIIIKGEAQSGKTTVATAIKHLLEKHGAKVTFTDGTAEQTAAALETFPSLKESTKKMSPLLSVEIVTQDKK